MPWYAVVEQRGEQRYTAWIVERGLPRRTMREPQLSAMREIIVTRGWKRRSPHLSRMIWQMPEMNPYGGDSTGD